MADTNQRPRGGMTRWPFWRGETGAAWEFHGSMVQVRHG